MSRVHLSVVLISLAGCGALGIGSSSSSSSSSAAATSAYGENTVHTAGTEVAGASGAPGATVQGGSDNFAAMNEVPVGGGELRLTEPRRTRDDTGQTVTAI